MKPYDAYLVALGLAFLVGFVAFFLVIAILPLLVLIPLAENEVISPVTAGLAIVASWIGAYLLTAWLFEWVDSRDWL